MAPLEVNRLARPRCWRRRAVLPRDGRGCRGWPGPRQRSCTGGRRGAGASVLPLLPLARGQETVSFRVSFGQFVPASPLSGRGVFPSAASTASP